MLHDQDDAMILMDPQAKDTMFKMDLRKGEIVEEWNANGHPIAFMAPESKFAQSLPENTILGGSANAIFRLDPRLSGSQLAELKQYKGATNFSGMVTTLDGHIAVSGDKGDIKLYDRVGVNAKTALPALGDPIIGIDVTKDGRWVVATCKTYLLVIDTCITVGAYMGQLGFQRSFPADSKPIPKRLSLKAAHIAHMGGVVNFSPARSNSS